MKRTVPQILATISIAGALVLLAAMGGMIGRYVQFRRQASAAAVRIADLEVAAREDAEREPELEEARAARTEASLERRARTRRDIAVLALAAIAFLGAGKSWAALRGRSEPSLGRIQEERAPPARRRWKRWRRAPPSRNGQDDAPEIDLSFVDQVVAEEGRSTEAAIPILQRIQSRYRYLPDEALRRVCELTDISPAQIAGVSTFYAQFRRSPVGRHIIKVCHGTACHVAGAQEVRDEIRRRLKIAPENDTDPERMFTVDEVACLGCCSLAPVIMLDETTAGRLTPASAWRAVEDYRGEHCE